MTTSPASPRVPRHLSRNSLPLLRLLAVLTCACGLVLLSGQVRADVSWPHMVPSGDGTRIAYETSGQGDVTLVFVHGWSCDSRYWRAQVEHFSQNYRVIVLDLAGHGNSGMSRETYSMRAFGQDVRAVAEATGSEKMILIGHSMGGPVIAEAARLLPGKVLGLIGVDTFINLERPMNDEQMEQILAPLRADFRAGSSDFIRTIFGPDTAPELRDWIVADMSSAPPAIAVSALEAMLMQSHTGEAATMFDEIRIPVHAIDADKWPVNFEANRRHMASFDATILPHTGHFLMMARPEEFNRALETVLASLTKDAQ
ncbi:MAG: alpha/beta fold hydrolase [Desulfovibrio sp.]